MFLGRTAVSVISGPAALVVTVTSMNAKPTLATLPAVTALTVTEPARSRKHPANCARDLNVSAEMVSQVRDGTNNCLPPSSTRGQFEFKESEV